jgi:hypothetical protein
MGETAMEAVEAASAAYNKDRDLHNYSGGSYQMHGKFCYSNESDLVKRLLNFDVGNR